MVYGLVGLKTHTKVALVVRREGDHIRRYCHVGTGNYNPKKPPDSYTDLGLLTGRDDIGADITDLFNYLTGYSRQRIPIASCWGRRPLNLLATSSPV